MSKACKSGSRLTDNVSELSSFDSDDKAKRIIESFEEYIPLFKKIVPHDYAAINKAISSFEEKGMDRDQAEIEAFFAVTSKGQV